jgi:hypothetical protein
MGALATSMFVLTTAAVMPLTARSDDGNELRAHLNGFQQVPSVFTPGKGEFSATLEPQALSYSLTITGLLGAVQVAHIHFGKARTNGGVIAFLCGGGGKPACGPSVSGTISAGDIQAIPAQGVGAGDFNAFTQALQTNSAYVNVHTSIFAEGEVRGQIRASGDERE